MSKNYKNRNNRNNKGNNNRSQGNRGMTAEQARQHNDRSDQMSKPEDGRNNNPTWYYTDPEMADQISRFSFNQFAGLSKPYGKYVPQIMGIYLNPSPGVTPINGPLATDPWREAAVKAQNKGINMASLKWWSILTATSGRIAPYTRNDVAVLILALSEVVSIYEYIRRTLGLYMAYSLRNRVLPQGLIEASGIDADDLARKHPNYRLRMNTLVARINQLPIPGNIMYIAKAQDLYQHIYADSDSPMAQFYVVSPSTTWVIDEDTAPETGTILRTVPVTAFTIDTDLNDDEHPAIAFSAHQAQAFHVRPLGEIIDLLENMVNKLVMSATFNSIYSDLLRMSNTANLTLWSFDSIKEDYVVVPEVNVNALMQIHNMTIMPPLKSVAFEWTSQELISGANHHPNKGITLNDVVCEPTQDVLLYNPTFTWDENNGLGGDNTVTDRKLPIVFDALNGNPSVDDRIDGTRYLVTPSPSSGIQFIDVTQDDTDIKPQINFVLPDHWCAGALVFSQNIVANTITIQAEEVAACGQFSSTALGDVGATADSLSVFDWGPQFFVNDDNFEEVKKLFDLNYYTVLDPVWLENVTDATYIGLMAIR